MLCPRNRIKCTRVKLFRNAYFERRNLDRLLAFTFLSYHDSSNTQAIGYITQHSRHLSMSLCYYVLASWSCSSFIAFYYGPLARYVKLQVAPGMPGTFFPPPQVSDSDMHHGTCVAHVPWCMPGSLTSGFLWSRWRGICSRNPQFYVSVRDSLSFTLFNAFRNKL